MTGRHQSLRIEVTGVDRGIGDLGRVQEEMPDDHGRVVSAVDPHHVVAPGVPRRVFELDAGGQHLVANAALDGPGVLQVEECPPVLGVAVLPASHRIELGRGHEVARPREGEGAVDQDVGAEPVHVGVDDNVHVIGFHAGVAEGWRRGPVLSPSPNARNGSTSTTARGPGSPWPRSDAQAPVVVDEVGLQPR